MDSRQPFDRFHGRVRGAQRHCAHPHCREAGEFRAPDPHGQRASANGPGDYQYLCLEHVRQFNAGYNWFAGMTAEEIMEAQSPINVWPSETRAFRASGNVDSPPKWADFKDPLDAISTRFRSRMPKERAEQMVLLEGEPSEAFEWFKVDSAVGNVRHQEPELIVPIGKILRGDERPHG